MNICRKHVKVVFLFFLNKFYTCYKTFTEQKKCLKKKNVFMKRRGEAAEEESTEEETGEAKDVEVEKADLVEEMTEEEYMQITCFKLYFYYYLNKCFTCYKTFTEQKIGLTKQALIKSSRFYIYQFMVV